MCPHCRAFIKTTDRICPYCDTEVGPRAADRQRTQEVLSGMVSYSRFLTSIILLINFGLYAATALYSLRAGSENVLMSIDGRTLFDFGAKYRPAIELGQWWRLITAGFLHGGLLHILMNSWVLYDLGAQVEEAYGTARMIVIYFVATVAGFFASSLWYPGLSVGASAGIFGLIGVMIALGVRHKSALGAHLRSFYMRWAIYGLVLGIIPGLRIDNAAHLGGLAAGFVVGYLAGVPITTRASKPWQVAAAVCILLTVLAFMNMYFWLTGGARS